MADRYRAQGTKVILGGLHVTVMPEEAATHADAIVLGEGELVWEGLVQDLQYKRLRTVYDARGRTFDLAQAPLPRFQLLDPAQYNRLTVQTQRGCPFDCEFCASSIRLSPKASPSFRVKPVAKVLEEIHAIKEIWPKPFIEFADDNTFAHKAHGKQLLRALVPEELRWFTETDISVAKDPELLDLMQESGCAQVLIGFESPSRAALTQLETKGDWKAHQRDHYLEAIDRIQSRGISINGCFVLGLDGTGVESFDEVLAFVRESGLEEVQITILTPFPGTPLYSRLLRTGRILEENAWERCTLFDINFVPDRMSVEELSTNFRRLMVALYDEEATQERKRRFRSILKKASRGSDQNDGGGL